MGRAGQVTGMLPFSRMTHFPLTARATTPILGSASAQRPLSGNAPAHSGAAAAVDWRVGGSNSRVQPGGTAARQVKCARQAFRRIGSRAQQSRFRGRPGCGGSSRIHAGAPADQQDVGRRFAFLRRALGAGFLGGDFGGPVGLHAAAGCRWNRAISKRSSPPG